MSREQLVGFRVVTSYASDDFELQQSALECVRRLKDTGIHATAFKVIRRDGREVLTRLRLRKPPIHH